MNASAQERLWITEPRRATCLAEVIATRGDVFQVDRALFAPRSKACRHPQNPDTGRVWWDGDKRKLGRVFETATGVWYRLRGTLPPVGTQLQCELDQDTRQEASRAHTAMHLFLSALPRDTPPLVDDPEVKGGGHARLCFARPIPPDVLAAVLRQANDGAVANTPVTREYLERPLLEAQAVHPVYADGTRFPEGEVLPVVRVGDACMPCDGTHVDRTGQIGRILVPHARMGKAGFVVNVRVG